MTVLFPGIPVLSMHYMDDDEADGVNQG